jgi:hypothetical protein
MVAKPDYSTATLTLESCDCDSGVLRHKVNARTEHCSAGSRQSCRHQPTEHHLLLKDKFYDVDPVWVSAESRDGQGDVDRLNRIRYKAMSEARNTLMWC